MSKYELEPVALDDIPGRGSPGVERSPRTACLRKFLASGERAMRVSTNGEDPTKLRERFYGLIRIHKMPIRVQHRQGALYLIRTDGEK